LTSANTRTIETSPDAAAPMACPVSEKNLMIDVATFISPSQPTIRYRVGFLWMVYLYHKSN